MSWITYRGESWTTSLRLADRQLLEEGKSRIPKSDRDELIRNFVVCPTMR